MPSISAPNRPGLWKINEGSRSIKATVFPPKAFARVALGRRKKENASLPVCAEAAQETQPKSSIISLSLIILLKIRPKIGIILQLKRIFREKGILFLLILLWN